MHEGSKNIPNINFLGLAFEGPARIFRFNAVVLSQLNIKVHPIINHTVRDDCIPSDGLEV